MYNSGSGLEALGRFETELTAKEGQRWYDRTIGGLTELSRQGLAAGQSGMQGITSMGNQTMSLGADTARTVTNANMGAAVAEGAAGRSLAELGPGIAGPIQGGMQNFMEYSLLSPILNKLAGNSSQAPSAPAGVSASVNPMSMASPAPQYDDFSTFG